MMQFFLVSLLVIIMEIWMPALRLQKKLSFLVVYRVVLYIYNLFNEMSFNDIFQTTSSVLIHNILYF